MSKHAADDQPAAAVVSPKVKAAGWVGVAITVAVTIVSVVLTSVTPEMLGALGPWAGPVAAGLVAGGAALAAYLKTDPLRNLGGAVTDMGGTGPAVPVAEEPVVELPAPETVPDVTVDVTVEDYLTPEADALAAKAAAYRNRGEVS